MNKRVFEYYQYLAPALLAPLSFWLWWRTFSGNLWLVLLAWLLPIMYSYIVPAVGTNILKVWEFDTRYRLGRFRPHHGFVFGSATAMIGWLCHYPFSGSSWDIFTQGFLYASVLGFWNILYDIKAIQSGILKVYNQPWAEHRSAEAIVMDYAPWFFAGFGAVYGAALAGAEVLLHHYSMTSLAMMGYFIFALLVSMALPVTGYRWRSFRVHGHSGCKPIMRLD